MGGDQLTPEKIELLKKKISNWLRQSRYRARRMGITTEIEYKDLVETYENNNFRCAYSGEIADSPDHPFPIKDKAPFVLANIIPCCDRIKRLKGNRNIIKFYQDGYITEEKLHNIIKQMLSRDGGEILKEYIKKEIQTSS